MFSAQEFRKETTCHDSFKNPSTVALRIKQKNEPFPLHACQSHKNYVSILTTDLYDRQIAEIMMHAKSLQKCQWPYEQYTCISTSAKKQTAETLRNAICH